MVDSPGLHAEQGGVKFIWEWLLATMFPSLLPLILQGALDVSADKDKDYFISKKEKQLGCKFQEVVFQCPTCACFFFTSGHSGREIKWLYLQSSVHTTVSGCFVVLQQLSSGAQTIKHKQAQSCKRNLGIDSKMIGTSLPFV